MLFSHSFCLYVSNFGHSDWSMTRNVIKRADWLTLSTLVQRYHFVATINLNFGREFVAL